MPNICAKQIINLYYADYKFFFSKPNVVGIAYGFKITNGINTYEPSIHIFVEKKVSTNCIPNNCRIPSLYKGVKTDVIETGKFMAGNTSCMTNSLSCNSCSFKSSKENNYTGRVRPIQPGWSMSADFFESYYRLTGTFSYIVTDNEQVSKTYCLLSVNGTFADWNEYIIGGEILQPSSKYGGSASEDVIAKLLRYCPLVFKRINDPEPPLSQMNIIDASVASLYNVGTVQLINPFIPPNFVIPTGIITPEVGMSINWTGCVSGGQGGNITSIKAILKAIYTSYLGDRACWFKDVNLATGLYNANDEGSLVYNRGENFANVIGLLFANGSAHNHIAICNMSSVQEILKITLATEEMIKNTEKCIL